jgi:hypothetical protein
MPDNRKRDRQERDCRTESCGKWEGQANVS